MLVDGIAIKTMKHNDRFVASWIHNGKEVLTESVIYSAELQFNNEVPQSVSGTPFIDTYYLASVQGVAYAQAVNAMADMTTTIQIGTLTNKALSTYKYAKIYYTAVGNVAYKANFGSSLYPYAECLINEDRVVKAGLGYTDGDVGVKSISGVYVVPIENFSSLKIIAFCDRVHQADLIYAGIGITRIALSNKSD